MIDSTWKGCFIKGGSHKHQIVGRVEGKCHGGQCMRCGLRSEDLDACWCTYGCNTPEEWAQVFANLEKIKSET